jgi:hypothetical protein
LHPETTSFALAADRAVAKVIDGDAVVIDTVTGRYYSLEGVGETAWSLIVSSVPLREAAAIMRERYETGDADVVADLTELAEKLLEENLIVEAPEAQLAALPPGGAKGAYSKPELVVYRDMEDLLAFDPPLPAADLKVWSAPDD